MLEIYFSLEVFSALNELSLLKSVKRFWWGDFTMSLERAEMCMKKMPKEVCMDGQVVRVPWGLASHLVSGNVGEIGEGLKENKV